MATKKEEQTKLELAPVTREEFADLAGKVDVIYATLVKHQLVPHVDIVAAAARAASEGGEDGAN